jgi:hypothetical protein
VELIKRAVGYYSSIQNSAFRFQAMAQQLELTYYVYHPDFDVQRGEANAWRASQQKPGDEVCLRERVSERKKL